MYYMNPKLDPGELQKAFRILSPSLKLFNNLEDLSSDHSCESHAVLPDQDLSCTFLFF